MPLSRRENFLGNAKTGSTFYTKERRAAARENLEKHDWARAMRQRLFAPLSGITGWAWGPGDADRYVQLPDEAIWLLQPSTRIPRYLYPEAGNNLCPVHGEEIRKHNGHCAWRLDPLNHPYQIQCPVGGEWYPSNAYHLGDMTSGAFPDDGNGYLQDGIRYFFLREYAHMVYGSVVIPALDTLSQAYLLTGDPRFAHKCAVLLAKVALEYPNYGWDKEEHQLEDRSERTYLGPWGHKYPNNTGARNLSAGGLITSPIWEVSRLMGLAKAYDALWDYLPTDEALVEFVCAHGLAVENGAALRDYIHAYILRAGAKALLIGRITGNVGSNQASALLLALIMDDFSGQHPNSLDLVNFAYFHPLGAVSVLRRGLYPDGGGHESPYYNTSKYGFINMAQTMAELRRRRPGYFPESCYPDLFKEPKARMLFDHNIDIVVGDGNAPSAGDGDAADSCRRAIPVLSLAPRVMRYGAECLADPRHARACFNGRGELPGADLWELFPETQIRELAARPEGAIERTSRLIDPFGLAILESGDFARRRCAVLNYTNCIGHRQQDALNLELYARRFYVLQDPGYPKSWLYRWTWDSNSMTHNTVTVDETQPPLFSYNRPMQELFTRAPGTGENRPPPEFGGGGRARLFASAEGVHVTVASHEQYQGVTLGRQDAPPVSVYERMTILVDVDDDRFYLVDLFSVDGGEQHDQSWHTFPGPCEEPALKWRHQEGGTLAGSDVEQFAGYTDRWGRVYPEGHFPSYLASVARAEFTVPTCWDWKSSLPEGDGLRLHVIPLGGPAEAIRGKGRSPVRDELEYVLIRRQAEKGKLSRFLSVLDPYQGKPQVRGVRLVSEAPLSFEVDLGDEIHEITLEPAESPVVSTAPREMGVRIVVKSQEKVTRDITIGAGTGQRGWEPGTVMTIENGWTGTPEVTVSLDEATGRDAFVIGRWVRIYSECRSAMYRIMASEPGVGNTLKLVLDKTLLLGEGDLISAEGTRLQLDPEMILAREWQGASLSLSRDLSTPVATMVYARNSGEIEVEGDVSTLGSLNPGTHAYIWEFRPGARIETPLVHRRCH